MIFSIPPTEMQSWALRLREIARDDHWPHNTTQNIYRLAFSPFFKKPVCLDTFNEQTLLCKIASLSEAYSSESRDFLLLSGFFSFVGNLYFWSQNFTFVLFENSISKVCLWGPWKHYIKQLPWKYHSPAATLFPWRFITMTKTPSKVLFSIPPQVHYLVTCGDVMFISPMEIR